MIEGVAENISPDQQAIDIGLPGYVEENILLVFVLLVPMWDAARKAY